jgi:hypothetical protein
LLDEAEILSKITKDTADFNARRQAGPQAQAQAATL